MSASKEKKWRNRIKKLDEKRKKKADKKAYDKNWDMYESAGCYKCRDGQLYSGGGDSLSITYYRRCKCANIKTKKYKKFLKKRKKMKYADAMVMEQLFLDNNSHITIGDNEEDRSW